MSRERAALGLLIAALLLGAALFDPASWPRSFGLGAAYHQAAGEWTVAGTIEPEVAAGLYLPYLPPLSAAYRLLGARGPALLNALCLAVALWVAAGAVGWRGASPVPLLALTVAGTLLPWQMLLAEPWILLLSLSTVAMALAYRREPPPVGLEPETFPWPEPPWRFALRWLAVGALLVLVAAAHPFYLALLVAAAFATSGEGPRRGGALGALGAGAVAGLVLVVALHVAIVGRPALALGAPAGLGGLPPLDPSLHGWNLVYLLVGRHIGLLLWCLPALLLAVAGWRSPRRRPLVLAVAAATALLAVAAPFDLSGDAEAFGNRRFLPLLGALLLAPRASMRPRWLLLVALGAALTVGPLWLAPYAPPVTEAATARHAAGPVARRLPLEHTQRSIPAAAVGRFGPVWLRTVDGAWATRNGALRFDADAGATFLVAMPAERDNLWLVFGPGAGAVLEVAGGTAGDTLFRPDGSVAFEIRLDRPIARHAAWLGEGAYRFDRLTLQSPTAEVEEVEMTPDPALWTDP